MKEPKNTILVKIFTTDSLLDSDLRTTFAEQVSPLCAASLEESTEAQSAVENTSDSISFRLVYTVSPTTTSTISKWLASNTQGRAEKIQIDKQDLPIQAEEIRDAIEDITVKREIVSKNSL